MTIELFKNPKTARLHCQELRRFFKPRRITCVVIKIRFDRRDRAKFGMRGFVFSARHGSIYYITAESRKDAKSWGLYSEIL